MPLLYGLYPEWLLEFVVVPLPERVPVEALPVDPPPESLDVEPAPAAPPPPSLAPPEEPYPPVERVVWPLLVSEPGVMLLATRPLPSPLRVLEPGTTLVLPPPRALPPPVPYTPCLPT